MQPMKSETTTVGTRLAWEPPTAKRLAIGAETGARGATGSGSATPGIVQPSPPADPATKLGFSIEMAFPLSARLEQ